MTDRVQAKALQPGDITAGSGERVVQVSAGVRTPRGKVEVTLERGGLRRTATWGANTQISIVRAHPDVRDPTYGWES